MKPKSNIASIRMITMIAGLALASGLHAGVIIPNAKIASGTVAGNTIIAINSPGSVELAFSTTGAAGPDWTDNSVDGWRRTAAGSTDSTAQGNSPWEPDGAAIKGQHRFFNSGTSIGQTYTFNQTDSGVDLPDGSVIHGIYATWTTRGVSGAIYSFTEGVSNTATISHIGAPSVNLALNWTNDLAAVQTANFQKIFTGPISVSGGNGFLLNVAKSGNTHQTDAVLLDVSLPKVGAPTIATYSPADEASGVSGVANLMATFDEPIQLTGVGSVTIYNVDTTSDFEVITLPDARVSISGLNLIINPTAALVPGTNYAVLISSDSIQDFDTVPTAFAGISDPTVWDFTIDNTPPTLASVGDNVNGFYPFLGYSVGGPIYAVRDTVTYTVTFNEPMKASSIDISDFENALTPAATINSVTATSNPAVYAVSVSPGGAGSLQVQIKTGATIEDASGNALNTAAPLPDDTTITVLAGANPTIALDGFEGMPSNSDISNAANAPYTNWETVTGRYKPTYLGGSPAALADNVLPDQTGTNGIGGTTPEAVRVRSTNGAMCLKRPMPLTSAIAGTVTIQFDLKEHTLDYRLDLQYSKLGDFTDAVTIANFWGAGTLDTWVHKSYTLTDGVGGIVFSDTAQFMVRKISGGNGGSNSTYHIFDNINITWAAAGGGSPEIDVNQGGDIANNGSKGFGTVTLGSNTSLIFTINNTGTAALNLSGTPPDYVAVSGTNAGDFTVTAQPTTPVTSGGGTTNFTVQFTPGGAGARNAVLTILNNDSDEGTFTINVSGSGQTKYQAWAGGALFDDDANNDGVDNGMAFLLGAGNPTSAVTLPTVTQSGGNLILNFNCLPTAARGGATLRVEHSSDLGILDTWTATTSVVPDADNAVPDNNVTFVVVPGPVGPPALNSVTATIDSAAAAAAKLFGRLIATE